jgi:heat shock protein HslJ
MREWGWIGLVLVLTGCTVATVPTTTPTPVTDADLAGNWQLVSGADASGIFPEATVPVTLIFGDDTLGGHGPCNWYGSDPSGRPYFPIAGIVSDSMGCPGNLEQRYFDALTSVTPASMTGDSLLLSGDGVELRFEPIPVQPIDDFVDIDWSLDSFTTGDVVSIASGESTLTLESDGDLAGSTGCRTFTGTWVEYLGQLGASDFDTRDGECTDADNLDAQDELELAMLTGGFRASVSGNELTLVSTTTDGQLTYSAN